MQAHWAQAASAKSAAQGTEVRSSIKGSVFSYLNKRYEQSSMPYLPVHPGQISLVSFLVTHQYFFQNDNWVSRNQHPAFLRGPPAAQS